MSAAGQVGFLGRGTIKWFSQRPKPYTNCMFAAVCVPLSYMGYDVPNDFVDRLRDASGVPIDRATSTGDTRRALRQLIPDCGIEYGRLHEDDLLRMLESGEIVARVLVRIGDLPAHSPTRKHFKSNSGGHAVTLAQAERSPGGKFTVCWLDPMGRPSNTYDGIRVPFDDIEPALKRAPEGGILVTFGRHNAALGEPADEVDRSGRGTTSGEPEPTTRAAVDPITDALVLTRGRPDEFASIPVGTKFRHPVTREVITHAVETADFRLAGRSTDGKFAGVWVNTHKIAGARGPTLLIVDREDIDPPFTP